MKRPDLKYRERYDKCSSSAGRWLCRWLFLRESYVYYSYYKPWLEWWEPKRPYIRNPFTFPFKWVFALGRRGEILNYWVKRPGMPWPCIELTMDYRWNWYSFPHRVQHAWRNMQRHRELDKEWVL